MHIRDQKQPRRSARGARAVLASVALALVGAACAGATGSNATPAARVVPATPAAPTATVVLPTAAATSVPTAASSAATAAAPVRFAVVAAATEARYRATEQLVGHSLPNDAVGTTRDVSGAIVLDPSGAVVAGQSKITVDLTTLQSDSGQRDNFVKRMTLQTARFPTAEFVPTGVGGLTQPLPTDGEVRFTLSGDLTVRGVTRPVTWDVIAQASPGEVSGTAATTVTFQDFGMTPPRAGPVLGVEDELALEIDFRATRQA